MGEKKRVEQRSMMSPRCPPPTHTHTQATWTRFSASQTACAPATDAAPSTHSTHSTHLAASELLPVEALEPLVLLDRVAREPLVRRLGEQPLDEVLCGAGGDGDEGPPWPHDLAREDAPLDLGLVLVGAGLEAGVLAAAAAAHGLRDVRHERQPSKEHLVDEHSEAPPVDGAAVPLVADNLHVSTFPSALYERQIPQRGAARNVSAWHARRAVTESAGLGLSWVAWPAEGCGRAERRARVAHLPPRIMTVQSRAGKVGHGPRRRTGKTAAPLNPRIVTTMQRMRQRSGNALCTAGVPWTLMREIT